MGGLRHTRPPQALPAAVTIAAPVVGIAALGGLASDVRSEWYVSLAKPNWQPPGWVFGPVWTVLYALLAVSAFLAWRAADGPRRRPLLALYAANGALNLAWPYIFFQTKQPVVAGIEILLLLATIVAACTKPRARLSWVAGGNKVATSAAFGGPRSGRRVGAQTAL
jgi:translocator protein